METFSLSTRRRMRILYSIFSTPKRHLIDFHKDIIIDPFHYLTDSNGLFIEKTLQPHLLRLFSGISLYLFNPMKFVLYKYLVEDGVPTILYVKGIYNGEPLYTPYAADAKNYNWLHALFLSLWMSVSWVNARYLKK